MLTWRQGQRGGLLAGRWYVELAILGACGGQWFVYLQAEVEERFLKDRMSIK
jgi:hypothetical protein